MCATKEDSVFKLGIINRQQSHNKRYIKNPNNCWVYKNIYLNETHSYFHLFPYVQYDNKIFLLDHYNTSDVSFW